MDASDAKLLTRIQSGFPIEARPFRQLGDELDMPEQEVLERIRRLKSSGLIRRIGATFHPEPLGYVSTLVGAQVPPERLEALAAFIGAFAEVTHLYEREGEWNLWFTLTAASAERLDTAFEAIRAEAPACRLIRVPARKRYKLRVEFDLGPRTPGSLADRCYSATRATQRFMLRSTTQNGNAASQSSKRCVARVKLDELDKRLIARLCGDLPIEARPFQALAEALGSTEDEVIRLTRRLERDGVLRRLGAIIEHRAAGLRANAMLAWVVPDEGVDEVGAYAASFDEVSHCYRRERARGWPYTLVAMVHAGSEARCREVGAAIVERFGLKEWVILPSRREFKKTSVQYFGPPHQGETDNE